MFTVYNGRLFLGSCFLYVVTNNLAISRNKPERFCACIRWNITGGRAGKHLLSFGEYIFPFQMLDVVVCRSIRLLSYIGIGLVITERRKKIRVFVTLVVLLKTRESVALLRLNLKVNTFRQISLEP